MKNVLFVIVNMEIGGTRTSLINLLNNLKKEKDLKIDLLLLSHQGDLIDQIPDNIRVRHSGFLMESFFSKIALKTPLSSLTHIIISVLKKVFGYRYVFGFLYKIIAKKLRNETEYDAVIGFQEGISDDAASYIYGNHHYSWIHSNIDVWYSEDDYCESTFEVSEKIIFVAEATMNKFMVKFPKFKNKCCVIKNTISPDSICMKSKSKPSIQIDDKAEFRFVSVGRFNPEKAFDRIVEVSNYILTNSKATFKWYVIGDGADKRQIETQIALRNLTDTVILLGSMTNPYSVMSLCDCLILTSLSESQPMVMLESLILGIPVITTRFDSAVEIANGAEHTYICQNSIEGLEEAILHFITDKKMRLQMKESARLFEYDANNIVSEIKKLL